MSATFDRSLSQHKAAFFDRELVLRYMNEREAKFLNKIGGWIRKTARRSMRRIKGPKASQPGDPPRARVGLLRDLLYYSFDHRERSVVIGPVPLNGRSTAGVPRLHEEGGTRALRVRMIYVKGKPVGLRTSKSFPVTNARYPARPFMKPALDQAIERQATFWPK